VDEDEGVHHANPSGWIPPGAGPAGDDQDRNLSSALHGLA
jgi:hypothetical protein